MSRQVAFTAVYEDVENGWVQARLLELPGVITAAPSRDEATEMLLDALAEYLRSFADAETPSGAGGTGTLVNVVISAA
jgi:predicted RNase H-like HicB family nuclease